MSGSRLGSNSWEEYSDKNRENNFFVLFAFPFGVLDKMWGLIVPVPYHYLSIHFFFIFFHSIVSCKS